MTIIDPRAIDLITQQTAKVNADLVHAEQEVARLTQLLAKAQDERDYRAALADAGRMVLVALGIKS